MSGGNSYHDINIYAKKTFDVLVYFSKRYCSKHNLNIHSTETPPKIQKALNNDLIRSDNRNLGAAVMLDDFSVKVCFARFP